MSQLLQQPKICINCPQISDIDNLASLKDLAHNTSCKMAQASVPGCCIAGPASGQRVTPP